MSTKYPNQAKWHKDHPEVMKISQKKWKEKNPDYFKNYFREHHRKAKVTELSRHRDKIKKQRRRGAIGMHTLQEWENVKREWNYCCARCGMQEPFNNQCYQKLTEDHIIPISKGGSNFIENIQPLCHRCNSEKGSR